MKKIWILLIILFVSLGNIVAQGLPFIRNFTAEEYKGHSQNFDIITGEDGSVFVANFEGLLYYDNSDWRIIHTPGITRITAVFRDSKNNIWTGGYNFLGHIVVNEKGELGLNTLDPKSFKGEITWIWEKNENIYFLSSNNNIYKVTGKSCELQPNEKVPSDGFTTLGAKSHVNQVQQLEDGLIALATNGEGVIILDEKGNELLSITEENGLCSNNVAHITYNKMGQIWGATDNGVFAIDFPSCYSRFTQYEGIRGEVLSLYKYDNVMYAGTLSGVYKKEGMKFVPIPEICYTCWQILPMSNHLLFATMDGIYRIDKNKKVKQLTSSSTLSLMDDGENFYSGEMDGVYYNTADGKRQKLNDIEKVVKILRDKTDNIWLQTIYGKIWKGRNNNFVSYTSDRIHEEVATLVPYNGNVKPILANANKPFKYPLYSFNDNDNTLWLTNNKGRMLYAFKENSIDEKATEQLKPYSNFSFRALYDDGRYLWLGGKEGISIIDRSSKPILMKKKPQIYIRSIVIGQDSILWGGYGTNINLAELPSNDRHIDIRYGLNYPTIIGKPQYRYRINGGKWSAWDYDVLAELYNQPYGRNIFEVQGRDIWGRYSEITRLTYTFEHPLYMRWYMILLYIIIIVLAVYLQQKFRVIKLEKDKLRLENIVKERTSEVVRLEKMATVGKLTQGLIDRILNPLNYINNFAKLSVGLVKDVEENIEDEKEHMDKENYEDTVDVLNMIKGNLEKVGEHGANTSRTLKTMEEMLKDRSGNMTKMDLTNMLRQDHDMLLKYYEEKISQYRINIKFDLPSEPIYINGNAEQLSKSIMSLLGNSIYAITKKYDKGVFSPELSLSLESKGKEAFIRVYDNGTGINENILPKIFDPFFTTKTTAEASGVGLYLSKEIAQNHGGDITVRSEIAKYTEFTIILPTL